MIRHLFFLLLPLPILSQITWRENNVNNQYPSCISKVDAKPLPFLKKTSEGNYLFYSWNKLREYDSSLYFKSKKKYKKVNFQNSILFGGEIVTFKIKKDALFFRFVHESGDQNDYIKLRDFSVPEFEYNTSISPNKESLLISAPSTKKVSYNSLSKAGKAAQRITNLTGLPKQKSNFGKINSIYNLTYVNFILLDKNMYHTWSFNTSSIFSEELTKFNIFELKKHTLNNESTLYLLAQKRKVSANREIQINSYKDNVNKFYFYSISNNGKKVTVDSISMSSNLLTVNYDYKVDLNGNAIFSALISEMGEHGRKGIYTCIIDKESKQVKSKNLSFFDPTTELLIKLEGSSDQRGVNSTVINTDQIIQFIDNKQKKYGLDQALSEKQKKEKSKPYNQYSFRLLPADSIYYIIAEQNYTQNDSIQSKDTTTVHSCQHVDNIIVSGIGLNGKLLWTKVLSKSLKRVYSRGVKPIEKGYEYSLKGNNLSLITDKENIRTHFDDRTISGNSSTQRTNFNEKGLTSFYYLNFPFFTEKYGKFKPQKRNVPFWLSIQDIIKVSEDEMILPVQYLGKDKRKKIGILTF